MKVKGIIYEDFVNYKKPSMYIAFPHCTFKCGRNVCQNKALSLEPDFDINTAKIVKQYLSNPLTHAVVFGGLEPLDSFKEVLDLIIALRMHTQDDIVIYTGYNKEERGYMFRTLRAFNNIIIKYGRYLPNKPPRFDKILGVELASSNQYAERYNYDDKKN